MSDMIAYATCALGRVFEESRKRITLACCVTLVWLKQHSSLVRFVLPQGLELRTLTGNVSQSIDGLSLLEQAFMAQLRTTQVVKMSVL